MQTKQGGTAGNPENPNLNSTFSEQDLIPRPTTCELVQYISPWLTNQTAMSVIVQQDATIYILLYFLQTALHVSDDTLIHHREHIQTVITCGTGRTVFVTVRWRGGVGTSSDSSTSADGGKYDSTSARCCNYSLHVLLMMGEGTTRNM